MLEVRSPTLLPGNSTHSFEVVTASLVYYVAAGEDGQAWANAIRQALMPFQSSGACVKETQGVCVWGGENESKLMRLNLEFLIILMRVIQQLLMSKTGRTRTLVQ